MGFRAGVEGQGARRSKHSVPVGARGLPTRVDCAWRAGTHVSRCASSGTHGDGSRKRKARCAAGDNERAPWFVAQPCAKAKHLLRIVLELQ
jgi:hypothetical protein